MNQRKRRIDSHHLVQCNAFVHMTIRDPDGAWRIVHGTKGPLSCFEARFQQKQLEEKEQKLVRMYETQQAQALKRVGGASHQNNISQNTGRVRQMFEERRTKAGIDKSYPLQPINSKSTSKQSTGGGSVVSVTSKTSTRNGYHTRVESFKSSNHQEANGYGVRQEVSMETRQKSNDLPTLSNTHHRFESDRILKDQNLNDDFLDDVSFPDGFEQMSLDAAPAKLPNVGGSLPSQRHAAKLKENNNNIVTMNPIQKSIDNVKMNGDSRVKISPITKKVSTSVKPVKSSSPAASSTGSTTPKTPKSVPSQQSSPVVRNNTTPLKAKTSTEKIQEIAKDSVVGSPTPKTPKTVPSQHSFPVKTRTASPKAKTLMESNPGSPKSGDGVACKICKRNFDPERLAKHQTICSKMTTKKRKPYDPVKHRLEGTGIEGYVKVQRKGNKVTAVPKSGSIQLKQSNWRQKHEDFINAIRAAKEMKAYIAKGGKLSDLPPPPPSENPDYVKCPHCGRRFNQSAADRHIPKCADFQFNKPKAGANRKR